LSHGRVMLTMKGQELFEDVTAFAGARMLEHLPTGDHMKGNAAEAHGDADANGPRIMPGKGPARLKRPEVIVAFDKIVSDEHQHGAERAIAALAKRSIRAIDLVALIPRGTKAGAAGDGAGIGIELNGPHFASALSRGDDVDSGNGHEKHVRCACDACREIPFESLNLTGFLEVIVMQREQHGEMSRSGCARRGGVCSPRSDAIQRALLKMDVSIAEPLIQLLLTGTAQDVKRGGLPQQRPGNGRFPEFAEALSEPRKRDLQVLADLALQGAAFADEIAAMTNEQLQLAIGFVPVGFKQREAIDGGAMNSGEVVVVSFAIGIARLAELFGSERMHDTRFQTSLLKSAQDKLVIPTRALDGDDQVTKMVLSQSMTDPRDRGGESGSVMLDQSGRNEDVSIEIGEHPFGTGFGTVHADDAESLGPDFLDPRMNDAARLVDQLGLA
jgi:hypothetical protein